MMADPRRGQGVPSNAWQNFRGGGLPLTGNHSLIGSCFSKLSLKWWREESCVNLRNHKPSSQCDAKIQTDTNLQPYCQLWFWHQHFELPTENRIWHLIPIIQSLSLKVLSVYLYLGEGETIYLCLLVIFFLVGGGGGVEKKGRKKKKFRLQIMYQLKKYSNPHVSLMLNLLPHAFGFYSLKFAAFQQISIILHRLGINSGQIRIN